MKLKPKRLCYRKKQIGGGNNYFGYNNQRVYFWDGSFELRPNW